MSFESKYLIRWGIPGWVFIFWVAISLLFVNGFNPLNANLPNLTESLTLLISLAAVGVPIGYVFHQLYFGLAWVLQFSFNMEEIRDEIPNKILNENLSDKFKYQHKDYFHLEYVWHSMLIDQNPETRAYLEGRYRHILGTIHALGALWMSMACSLIITAIVTLNIMDSPEFNLLFIACAIVQLLIFLSAMVNYKYFSNNLRTLQVKMLKKYLPPTSNEE